MKQQSKLTEGEQQKQDVGHISEQHGQEFSSVEALLRQDAEETKVPNAVGERLRQNANESLPANNSKWWQRWFKSTTD